MNINKYQLISIFLGIIIGLASTAIVYGWTNPTANPPGGTPGVLIRSGVNVGIGVTPTTRLDIDGQIRIRGGAPAVGRVLTSGADGTATWEAAVTGLPAGTSGQTLRHDGASWIANSFLTNTGTRIGINTASPTARVSILGEGTTSATQALNVANSLGTSMFMVRDDGNVGIGTTAPGARLEVFGTPGTQRITTIPSGTTGTYALSWDAFQICQFGTCSPPWRDLDGDTRTYEARTDCDEGCAGCFVGNTAPCPTTTDGRDQNCNGVVDEVSDTWSRLACQGRELLEFTGSCATVGNTPCNNACIAAGFHSGRRADCSDNVESHPLNEVFCWGRVFTDSLQWMSGHGVARCDCATRRFC